MTVATLPNDVHGGPLFGVNSSTRTKRYDDDIECLPVDREDVADSPPRQLVLDLISQHVDGGLFSLQADKRD
jgi:hypothetical protein